MSGEAGAKIPDQSCSLEDCSCTGKNLGKFTSPAALLAIAEAGCLSGYDIAERLRSMPLGGETGPDSGGLYRTLRRMERFNLVTSEWDTEGGGPARRVYRLTNLGDQCLQEWVKTLGGHRSAIKSFLDDYERYRREDAVQTSNTLGDGRPGSKPVG
jgi:PadR family transcriptional regulator PadR